MCCRREWHQTYSLLHREAPVSFCTQSMVYIFLIMPTMCPELSALGAEINHILTIASDPFTTWWNSLGYQCSSLLPGLLGFCLVFQSQGIAFTVSVLYGCNVPTCSPHSSPIRRINTKNVRQKSNVGVECIGVNAEYSPSTTHDRRLARETLARKNVYCPGNKIYLSPYLSWDWFLVW